MLIYLSRENVKEYKLQNIVEIFIHRWKLIESHLNPLFRKMMTVKLDTQVLNHY